MSMYESLPTPPTPYAIYPTEPPQWPVYAPPPLRPPRKSRAPLLIALGVLATLLVGGIIAALTLTGGTKSVTVHGTMSLIGGDNYSTLGGSCSGSLGYDDITGGAEVVISDDSGKTLAITQLDAGKDETGTCDFTFTAKIPAGKAFYGVEVTHRGVVKFTEAEVATAGVTLGDG